MTVRLLCTDIQQIRHNTYKGHTVYISHGSLDTFCISCRFYFNVIYGRKLLFAINWYFLHFLIQLSSSSSIHRSRLFQAYYCEQLLGRKSWVNISDSSLLYPFI